MRIPLVNQYVELVAHNRNFRFLWTSQIISLLGDWFNLIASAALVANLSGSGLAIGGLFIARLLPPFLFGPIAGVVADRFDRRQVLIVSDVCRTVVVLGFLFIRSESDIWLLYVLTTLQLSISAFFEPARAAVLPGLVSRQDLITANALSGATWSSMLALGAALGGVVTATLGTTSAFIIDAMTYLVSAWFITRIDFSQVTETDLSKKSPETGWRTFIDGIQYLQKRPNILIIALLKSSSALAFGGIEIVQVTFAKDFSLFGDDGSATLGLIYFMVGLGTGFGPIIAQRFTQERMRAMYWAIWVAYLTMIGGYLLLAWGPSLAVIFIGTLLRTVGTGINWVYSSSILQMTVPPNFLGRVFAFDLALTTLAAALSTLWAGWAKDTLAFSPHQISLTMAGVSLIMVIGWSIYLAMWHKRVKHATINN